MKINKILLSCALLFLHVLGDDQNSLLDNTSSILDDPSSIIDDATSSLDSLSSLDQPTESLIDTSTESIIDTTSSLDQPTESVIDTIITDTMPDTDFVNLRDYVPGIYFDIRYATPDNFTSQILYPNDACFLRRGTAKKLLAAVNSLLLNQLSVKIFDAYRPWSVQQIMWAACPDGRYVANPAIGSSNNRGAGIDLCLVRADGSPLPLQTPFDAFSELAARDYGPLPIEIAIVRVLLDDAMTSNGFEGIQSKWWHFRDTDYMNYAITDTVFTDTTMTYTSL